MSRLNTRTVLVSTSTLLLTGVIGAAQAVEDPGSPKSAPSTAIVRPLDIDWTEARECWGLFTRIDLGSIDRPDLGRRTVDRFLNSAHARDLVIDLCRLFADPAGEKPTSVVTIRFVDEIPASLDLPEGSFQPPSRAAEIYEVVVQIQNVGEVFDDAVFVFGQYPDNPNCAYTFFYQHAVSSMAQVLYHELLHIWFLNKYGGVGRRYPTGHGLVSMCEFNDEFLELLAANAAELSTIEGHPPLNFGSEERSPPGAYGASE